MRPSFVLSLSLLKSEGAGNAGGALHPRSHTQMEKGAHEHTGSAEAPGIPCVAALRLMPCSPRRRIRLVTVVGGFLRRFEPGRVKPVTADLAPATGVRTTRFCRTLETSFVVARLLEPLTGPLRTRPATPWRADALASTTSRPAFVTIAIRPSCRNGTGDLKPLIWGRCEAQSCPSCHLAATRRAQISPVVIPGSRRFASRPGMTR